jgi:hypothetical protein
MRAIVIACVLALGGCGFQGALGGGGVSQIEGLLGTIDQVCTVKLTGEIANLATLKAALLGTPAPAIPSPIPTPPSVPVVVTPMPIPSGPLPPPVPGSPPPVVGNPAFRCWPCLTP